MYATNARLMMSALSTIYKEVSTALIGPNRSDQLLLEIRSDDATYNSNNTCRTQNAAGERAASPSCCEKVWATR